MSLRDFVQPAALQQPLICSFTAPLGANSQWQGITLLQLLQSDQRRGIVNIPVENGKVARALRNMTRTLWNESLPEQIRSRQVPLLACLDELGIVTLQMSPVRSCTHNAWQSRLS